MEDFRSHKIQILFLLRHSYETQALHNVRFSFFVYKFWPNSVPPKMNQFFQEFEILLETQVFCQKLKIRTFLFALNSNCTFLFGKKLNLHISIWNKRKVAHFYFNQNEIATFLFTLLKQNTTKVSLLFCTETEIAAFLFTLRKQNQKAAANSPQFFLVFRDS